MKTTLEFTGLCFKYFVRGRTVRSSDITVLCVLAINNTVGIFKPGLGFFLVVLAVGTVINCIGVYNGADDDPKKENKELEDRLKEVEETAREVKRRWNRNY
ncbi:unnamed protein product [marine sediment metagenome]|uniref:Uncharacterized protein n=1 Tax=marine sediment metagenome TaxID=412755 RepID=X0WH41_9ZZZZ